MNFEPYWFMRILFQKLLSFGMMIFCNNEINLWQNVDCSGGKRDYNNTFSWNWRSEVDFRRLRYKICEHLFLSRNWNLLLSFCYSCFWLFFWQYCLHSSSCSRKMWKYLKMFSGKFLKRIMLFSELLCFIPHSSLLVQIMISYWGKMVFVLHSSD